MVELLRGVSFKFSLKFFFLFLGPFHLVAEEYSLEPFEWQSHWMSIRDQKSLSKLDLTKDFLPQDHPAKAKLDKLFSSSRVLLNLETLRKAGFKPKDPRQYTSIVTATHPEFPDYFFKLFLDAQRYDERLPLAEFWQLRIQGARLIQSEINKNGWQAYFKVPRKWIYPLPLHPKAPPEFAGKNYLLIEDKMDIESSSMNREFWKSDNLSADFLYCFFCLIRDTGFRDVKPENVPFCKDGRVAFIDTQLFLLPVEYDKITPFLSPRNQILWKYLIQTEQ